MPIDAMLQAGPIKQRKRRSSRLAVSTFNRFKQKEKVSKGLDENILSLFY